MSLRGYRKREIRCALEVFASLSSATAYDLQRELNIKRTRAFKLIEKLKFLGFVEKAGEAPIPDELSHLWYALKLLKKKDTIPSYRITHEGKSFLGINQRTGVKSTLKLEQIDDEIEREYKRLWKEEHAEVTDYAKKIADIPRPYSATSIQHFSQAVLNVIEKLSPKVEVTELYSHPPSLKLREEAEETIETEKKPEEVEVVSPELIRELKSEEIIIPELEKHENAR
ncbi:MAG: hypothetical protein AOA65_0098 [Candidatus Bathyarchaeota archaeon BA1]|nr:MAG: hypothetical protein AOA65_0098 [Candidatus Bathyarchaeota archaeon BA1]